MKYNKDSVKGNYFKFINLSYFINVIVICSISTFFSIAMNSLGIGKENTLMVFIVGVLTVTTVTRGYIYSAVAAVLSVVLFNYFFTE
ncbi:MAG: DUF4118 domain-containing protein, partial [Sedimentibacter sp.]